MRDITLIMNSLLLSRDQALQVLENALPRRWEYASRRNYALGVPTTTLLSPYIRRRLLEESEVLYEVLKDAAWSDVEKLVQEIVWRTYWKGWLEHNPEVWSNYLLSLPQVVEGCSKEVSERLNDVIEGSSSVECVNDWSKELTSTGYLHNHKRMWFASIWIFTLRLPWELGAKFFLERLLDGDPASNTLSWRWVAGVQTKGKRYLATSENIAKYTEKRWLVPSRVLSVEGEYINDYTGERSAPLGTTYKIEPYKQDAQKTVLLIHAEDLRPETLPLNLSSVSGVVIYRDTTMHLHQPTGLLLKALASALDDVSLRIHSLVPGVPTIETSDTSEVCSFLSKHQVKKIVTAKIFQGFLRDQCAEVVRELSSRGIVIQEIQREYDTEFHPLARRGFFPFWEGARNRVLEKFSRSSSYSSA